MGTHWKIIRDSTRLTKETLEKVYTTPVIDGNANLKQACDQFNEELHKMLDRAVPPQKGMICRQAQNCARAQSISQHVDAGQLNIPP